MYFTTKFFSFASLLLLLISCQTEFIPETAYDGQQLVVEGYIQHGDNALPPYVILTHNLDFFSELNLGQLDSLFVHDAEVWVSDGIDSIKLTELCLNDLPDNLREQASLALGLGNADSVSLNVCVYTDPNAFLGTQTFIPQIGKTYNLRILSNGKTVTASTTIPPVVPLDSIKQVNHPNYPENDSLVEVRCFLTDPANQENFYRYFTQRNSEPMYPGGGGSVSRDRLYNGRSFEFPIARGQSVTDEFDFNTFGYFWRGDTVIARMGSIDRQQIDFWEGVEASASGGQSPFSSYVRIVSNIKGGLGVWGGYSYTDYVLILN